MTVVPAVIPVTVPVLFIVATVVFEEPQFTDDVKSTVDVVPPLNI